MSAASPTRTLRTVMPLMSMPRIRRATPSASVTVSASLTPPALPRPPTSTWALTTTRSAPVARIRSAAARASAAEGGHEPAAGPQPSDDAFEHGGMQLARDVRHRRERRDAVERLAERQGSHVPDEEASSRHELTCPGDLARRDVDAGGLEATGERDGQRDAGTAAQLEHPTVGWDALGECLEPRHPRVALDAVDPVEVPIDDRVVSVGDAPPGISGHA